MNSCESRLGKLESHDIESAAGMIADLPRGAALLADKGLDANVVRAALTAYGAWANISPKAD